jgi:WD40 repeat protein
MKNQLKAVIFSFTFIFGAQAGIGHEIAAGSFQGKVHERLPLQILKDSTWTRSGTSTPIRFRLSTVFDSDTKLLLRTDYSIDIRSVDGFKPLGTLQDSDLGFQSICNVNPSRTLLLCSGRSRSADPRIRSVLYVWDLKTQKLIWTYNYLLDARLRALKWIDDKTIVYQPERVAGFYTIQVGTQSSTLLPSTLGTSTDGEMQDSLRLAGSSYLVWKDPKGISLLTYPKLTEFRRFDGAARVLALLDGKALIVVNSTCISRFEPAQDSFIWTKPVPLSIYGGYAVGKSNLAISDHDGNVKFYDLVSGEEQIPFMDSLLGDENGQDLYFGADGKTLYRGSAFSVSYPKSKGIKEIYRASIPGHVQYLQVLNSGDFAGIDGDATPTGPRAIQIYSADQMTVIGNAPLSREETGDVVPWINASGTEAITEENQIVNHYDLLHGKRTWSVSTVNLEFPKKMAVSPDGKSFFAINRNNPFQIVRVNADGTQSPVFNETRPGVGSIKDFSVDSTAKFLFVSLGHGYTFGDTYTIWDLVNGRTLSSGGVVKNFPNCGYMGDGCPIVSGEFRHGDEILIYTLGGTLLRSVDSPKDKKVFQYPDSHWWSSTSVIWGILPSLASPNERFYLLEDPLWSIGRIFDAQNGLEVAEIWGPEGGREGACFPGSLPGFKCDGLEAWAWQDDDTIVTSGMDSHLRKWKISQPN